MGEKGMSFTVWSDENGRVSPRTTFFKNGGGVWRIESSCGEHCRVKSAGGQRRANAFISGVRARQRPSRTTRTCDYWNKSAAFIGRGKPCCICIFAVHSSAATFAIIFSARSVYVEGGGKTAGSLGEGFDTRSARKINLRYFPPSKVWNGLARSGRNEISLF